METSTKVIVALGVVLIGWALFVAATKHDRAPTVVYQTTVLNNTIIQPVETHTIWRETVQVQQPLEHGADCIGIPGNNSDEFVLQCRRVIN